MFKNFIFLAFLIQPFVTKAHSISFPEKNMSNGDKTSPGVICKCYGEFYSGAATIYWKTYEGGTNSRFFIERSENGEDFKQLDSVTSADGINFIYKDTLPLPTGFYRVKAVPEDTIANTIYSDVMRLSSLSGMPKIKVSPSLFDAQITVELDSKISEAFNIALTNSKGEVLSSRLVNAEKGANTIVFEDGISFLYADEYTMSITGIKYSFAQKLYKK